jgi:hypothetical protein
MSGVEQSASAANARAGTAARRHERLGRGEDDIDMVGMRRTGGRAMHGRIRRGTAMAETKAERRDGIVRQSAARFVRDEGQLRGLG